MVKKQKKEKKKECFGTILIIASIIFCVFLISLISYFACVNDCEDCKITTDNETIFSKVHKSKVMEGCVIMKRGTNNLDRLKGNYKLVDYVIGKDSITLEDLLSRVQETGQKATCSVSKPDLKSVKNFMQNKVMVTPCGSWQNIIYVYGEGMFSYENKLLSRGETAEGRDFEQTSKTMTCCIDGYCARIIDQEYGIKCQCK